MIDYSLSPKAKADHTNAVILLAIFDRWNPAPWHIMSIINHSSLLLAKQPWENELLVSLWRKSGLISCQPGNYLLFLGFSRKVGKCIFDRRDFTYYLMPFAKIVGNEIFVICIMQNYLHNTWWSPFLSRYEPLDAKQKNRDTVKIIPSVSRFYGFAISHIDHWHFTFQISSVLFCWLWESDTEVRKFVRK